MIYLSLRRLALPFLLIVLLPLQSWAETFRVNDIRIEGLQRLSAGTVFSSLPVQIGDQLSAVDIQTSTRALFRTGYFADITMIREGEVLVVRVQERPAISEIVIEGNEAISTDDLLKGLSDNGLSEGQIFKQATLEGMNQSLQRQYVSQGRYGSSVEADVEELPRNQVKLNINIDEGEPAAISHINIIGNQVFEEQDLRDLFELKSTGWLSWLNSNDKYSREKLSGDLERLESHYLDRGYLQFSVDSTQVSISPDKESVYITVNISEGDSFRISEVELAGDPVLPEEQIERLILLSQEQVFSQALMTTSKEYIEKRLGNEGYTFAEVQGIPELNDQDKTVKVTFFINPGKRAYVRRIDFRGNTGTSDNVLRREMRQMEGGSASTAQIEYSKVRLERTGYFKEVEVETSEVPGQSDQVDVEYFVVEQPSGSIGASVGYAQGTGAVLGANVQQDNWFGTGKQVGFSVNTSPYQTVYSFNYTDPYFTPDGVSRGFNIFYRERDFEEVNISSYTTDTFGGGVSFGYPISEIERVGFGFGYSNISIETGDFAVQEIIGSPRVEDIDWAVDEADYTDNCLTDSGARQSCDLSSLRIPVSNLTDSQLTSSPAGFIDENGDEFDKVTFSLSWSQSTLNRGRLATRGASQRASVEVALPGSDLEYYRLTYEAQYFRPLTKNFTLRLRSKLGYSESYGSTTEVPFFEHFYAGGFGSVRGFKKNTLGPQSTPATRYDRVLSKQDGNGSGRRDDLAYVIGADGRLTTDSVGDDDDPFGGNVLVEGSVELLFPMPFIKDQRTIQSAFFIDAGNVFDTHCGEAQQNCFDVDFGKLSASVGIGVTWITGFGPLTFSLAKPIKENDGDDPEVFQFSLGSSF